MENCLFCRFKNEKNRVIFEGQELFAIFDNYPVSPGHFLIIPKRHVIDLLALNEQEWLELKIDAQTTVSAIKKIDLRGIYGGFVKDNVSEQAVWFCKKVLDNKRINTEPDGYNYGLNDGKAAGRTVNHLHWHVIPRYRGDMDDPRGGVRYVIPEMGNYKIPRN